MTAPPVFDSIAGIVGNTPLLRLHRTVPHPGIEVFAKLEYLNPMSSVKDRIARFMVEAALEKGELAPGGRIIESSSGNTAMGMAMMAILKGLKCTMVVRKQTSQEKLDCLRAMGVDLVEVDGNLPPEDPESYNQKARRLAQEHPDWWFPDQHNNRRNNEAHYRSTGPEIWEQMEGRIDYLVAGIGTGGTICGVSRFLKEQDPAIQVIAVDPAGSVFFDYFHHGRLVEAGHYLIEGLGDEEIISCPNFELIDDMYRVTDREAFLAARDLARLEAVFAGGSSGAALWAVRRLAATLEKPARIVTLFPDSGSRYLSTIFNDRWMLQHGFLEDEDGGVRTEELEVKSEG